MVKVLDMSELEIDQEVTLNLVKIDPVSPQNLIATVENLKFDEFVIKFNSRHLEIIDLSHLNPPPSNDTFLMSETLSTRRRLKIIKADTVIPYIETTGENEFYTNTNSFSVIEKGFILVYNIPEVSYKLFCYVPFFGGKKIYAYMRKLDTEIYSVICYGQCKYDEIIPSIIEPEGLVNRNFSDKLNENDIVRSSNVSSRFKKLAEEEWVTYKNAIFSLHDFLYNTVDPSYMLKILELNHMLSYPGL